MTSEASSTVNLLDTVPLPSVSRSMASSPSACSILSEGDRQSPFTLSSALNSSPSSPFTMRQPECGASTSRSSLDSSRLDLVEQLAQNSQYRRRRRTHSSDSSGSDEGSVGGMSHVSSIGGLSRSQDNDEEGEGSRKTSVETPIRQADMPRGRLANIRRESSCTPSDEMAHERMTTAGIQVSSGWDDAMRIGGSASDDTPTASGSSSSAAASPAGGAIGKEEELVIRRRLPSAPSAVALSELTVFTHTWLPPPHSCSPSPTRMSESGAKQCYSPSTQKIVRPNIPYSPSPSPTASPTRKRLMTARSQSPIASRSALKRRADGLPSSPVGAFPSMTMGGSSSLSLGSMLHDPFSGASSSLGSLSSGQSGGSGGGGGGPPSEKRACPGGTMGGGGGYARNCTSPLVIMDARASAAAAAAAIRRSTLFLVDPELRRASTDSYTDLDGSGSSRDGVKESKESESFSEPSSVLMPSLPDDTDAIDADALLFRAPSVPPPLSVGSNSSRYECPPVELDEMKSTVEGGEGEEKMEEEEEILNTSSSSLSLLGETSKDDETAPSECSEADDLSQKEEQNHTTGMEE